MQRNIVKISGRESLDMVQDDARKFLIRKIRGILSAPQRWRSLLRHVV